MTINPSKLRTCIAQGAKALIVDAQDMPMIEDALEIADSCARADIESYCASAGKSGGKWWWNTADVSDDSEKEVELALRYLEARGLIERDPRTAAVVGFKEPA